SADRRAPREGHAKGTRALARDAGRGALGAGPPLPGRRALAREVPPPRPRRRRYGAAPMRSVRFEGLTWSAAALVALASWGCAQRAAEGAAEAPESPAAPSLSRK